MVPTSTPDNEFVDVEATDRPLSSASTSSQRQQGLQLIDALPEVKRSRGRPRKVRDTIEDGEFFSFSFFFILLFRVVWFLEKLILF